ncbi:hypothetical protein KSP35_12310 [Aquihabitans sp. G128]|uniref:hypothetical protein n=1 Tax=Aquihabitans sp. G128 TaxID=2849779 RepID=UPI001C20FACF|nr:hypothetical protein [Aquihabitans sp. G128]QXC59194.1 hypothetical protein KSP35_12310 [Aquihabitans sp. G128]
MLHISTSRQRCGPLPSSARISPTWRRWCHSSNSMAWMPSRTVARRLCHSDRQWPR